MTTNSNKKLTILFCKYKSICEPGVEHAFHIMGHTVDELTEPFRSDFDSGYLEILSSKLIEKNYDFVFSINFQPIISRVCTIFKIPYLCWTVDSPCSTLYSDSIKSPFNRIFIFDKKEYIKYHSYNPKNIFHLPLGCDYDAWNSLKLTENDHQQYDCDISFIGSTYQEKCIYNEIEKKIPPYLRGYVDGIIQAQMNVYGYNFIEDSLTKQFCNDFSKFVDCAPPTSEYIEDQRGIIANTFIGEKCTEQERLLTLTNISNHFNIDLYTMSDVSSLPNVHFCGAANSKTMMPKIFKCSKINLNMTSRSIQTGLPLRIFDIMCAGGFCLTNFQAEIPEYFSINEDLVVYDSQQDLLSKISYFLSHEDERKTISQNGQKKVIENYTYEIQLKKMLTICGFIHNNCSL